MLNAGLTGRGSLANMTSWNNGGFQILFDPNTTVNVSDWNGLRLSQAYDYGTRKYPSSHMNSIWSFYFGLRKTILLVKECRLGLERVKGKDWKTCNLCFTLLVKTWKNQMISNYCTWVSGRTFSLGSTATTTVWMLCRIESRSPGRLSDMLLTIS